MSEKEKRGSASLALKAGIWYVISTFLVKGLSFITTPIFSRLLSTQDYGEFSNFASWQVMLLIVTGAELYNTVARAYYDFEHDFDGYVSSITIVSCVLTLSLYLIFLICQSWLLRIVSIPPQFIHILFFTLMFQSCKQIYIARERTLYRYKSVAMLTVINLVIPTTIAVALVLLAQDSQRLAARIYGFYLPSALIGLTCAAVLLYRGRTFKWKHCRYAFALALPLVVHYLTAHFLGASNTIVTKIVLGAEAVAPVSIANSTNHILTLLLQAISGALTTWLMDNMQQENRTATRKGLAGYVIGICFLGTGVMLLAPEFVWILGGSRYALSVTLMPGMIMGALVQAITTIFTIMLTYQKRVVKTALYTGIVSVLAVAAKYFLLPYTGVVIVPYINVVALVALLVINYVLVCKSGCGDFVNFKAIVGMLVCMCLVMAGCYFLYEHLIARCIVIGIGVIITGIIALRYREYILKFVKKTLGKKKKQKLEE